MSDSKQVAKSEIYNEALEEIRKKWRESVNIRATEKKRWINYASQCIPRLEKALVQNGGKSLIEAGKQIYVDCRGRGGHHKTAPI